jgi:hypothetical protein
MCTSGSVGGLGGRPPRSTRPLKVDTHAVCGCSRNEPGKAEKMFQKRGRFSGSGALHRFVVQDRAPDHTDFAREGIVVVFDARLGDNHTHVARSRKPRNRRIAQRFESPHRGPTPLAPSVSPLATSSDRSRRTAGVRHIDGRVLVSDKGPEPKTVPELCLRRRLKHERFSPPSNAANMKSATLDPGFPSHFLVRHGHRCDDGRRTEDLRELQP